MAVPVSWIFVEWSAGSSTPLRLLYWPTVSVSGVTPEYWRALMFWMAMPANWSVVMPSMWAAVSTILALLVTAIVSRCVYWSTVRTRVPDDDWMAVTPLAAILAMSDPERAAKLAGV